MIICFSGIMDIKQLSPVLDYLFLWVTSPLATKIFCARPTYLRVDCMWDEITGDIILYILNG